MLRSCALLALLAGCGGVPVSAPAPVPARDIHSAARPEEARVTHLDLDLRVDFQEKRLAGTAALDLEVSPGARTLVLDTRDLEIEQVTGSGGAVLRWSLGDADSILGAPLTIELPTGVRRVVVRYRTSPGAAA